MKSILKVLVNILSFGVPSFISVLSKSRKFTQLINDQLFVSVDDEHVKVYIPKRDGNWTSFVLAIDVNQSTKLKEGDNNYDR